MKVRSLALAGMLIVGLVAPAHATGQAPAVPHPVCVLDHCSATLESYPTGQTASSFQFGGIQHIELATDGKIWFVGTSEGSLPNFVGYIEPWNKAAGVHICDTALLTHNSTTIDVFFIVPGDDATMDAVGYSGGIVRYNSDCSEATYPTSQPISDTTAGARDVNGHIWATYTGASSIKDLNGNAILQGNWALDLTSGPDNLMWAVDGNHNTVIDWNPTDPINTYETHSLVCNPLSIASDRNRFLWITCSQTDSIIRVDTASGHHAELAYYNVPTSGGVGLPGITVSNDGVVWLTDQGDHVVRAFQEITTGTGGMISFEDFSKSQWISDVPMLRDITTDFDNNAWYIDSARASIEFIGVNPVGPNPVEKQQTAAGCATANKWTIYFKERSAKLTSATKATLDCVATQVGKAKSIKIYGYTMTNKKSAVSKAANKVLAKKRAKAVRKYLRAHGVKAKITLVAKGAVDPASKSDQSKNRRVVIIPKYLALFKQS
jgi:outer membrane protein OmpA-like peptidoglycan-associated protein